MKGVITKRHVISHPHLVIQGFGLRVFLRALAAGSNDTFFEVIVREWAQPVDPTPDKTFVFDQMTRLELRISHIYRILAGKFANENKRASKFFSTLARHERGHAELIRLAKLEMLRGRLRGDLWRVEHHHLEEAGKLVRSIHAQAHQAHDLPQALDYVRRLENSSANLLFDSFRVSLSSRRFSAAERIVFSTQQHERYYRAGMASLEREFALTN
ncbi:MAG: hypothetical protein JW937_03900 [Candidatus Omnitrophica bacterium]|nr:hypothetical protein [Candidatus Omnitrophota bacterium]